MGDGLLVIAHDVADEHHFWESFTLALGAVAHSPKVAFIEVLKACELRATRAGIEVALDLDDGRHGILGIAKEL